MFERAQAKPGITGESLAPVCELRLDNVVFRLNISPTRRGARQLVGHRHVTVNGKVVNIPSYRVRPGDVVVFVKSPSPSRWSPVALAIRRPASRVARLGWQCLAGTVIAVPSRDQIPENIKESLIVELYSK